MPPNTQHAQAESRGDDSRSNSKLKTTPEQKCHRVIIISVRKYLRASHNYSCTQRGGPTIQQQLFVLLAAILSLDCVPTFVLARRLD